MDNDLKQAPMKKIAYINPDCFIHVDLTVLAELAKEFDILWIPILSEGFAEYSEDYLRGYAEETGIRIQIMHAPFRMRSPKYLRLFLSLVRQINKEGFDLIFCAHNNPYWMLASRLLEAPLVFGIHDFEQHSNFKRGRLLHYTTQLGIKHCRHFLFYSGQQLIRFRERFPDKSATNVGMVALDYGKSNLTPPPICDGVKLLFFGRIDSYKGLDLLISDIESLYGEGTSNISVTIRGRGPFWDYCTDLVVHKELFDLQIRFIENDDIPDLFASHHFLVLPYRDTTQSGPMMIAIRYGLPVIAPRFPSFMEYCTEENSLLYQPGELTDALKRCASMDDKTYQIMRNDWDTVSIRCTPPAIASNYIRFFHEII